MCATSAGQCKSTQATRRPHPKGSGLGAHVTLSEKQGQQQLLSMLAPVREVFDLKQLGFEEIMQRDIDDARVSLELIPYLLDTSTSGQIKLFPPIVAVALPLKGNSRESEAWAITCALCVALGVTVCGHANMATCFVERKPKVPKIVRILLCC